jgi:hypothetical protein
MPTMIRYTVHADQAAHNEELVRAVYAELASTRPAGLRYATFKLDDGQTFLHLADAEQDPSPLLEVAAFRAFRAGLADRCSAPPARTALEGIGAFGW